MLTQTKMEKEAREAPQVIENQWKKNESIWLELAKRLHKEPVPFAVTIARGSSDHAATFLKYLLEVKLGIPTVSAAPSVLTIYQQNLNLKGALVVGISQSGQSPDLVEMMKSARHSGAITVAVVNTESSPLAQISEYVVPLYAGKEEAVAATKSYIGSLSAFLHFMGVYEKSCLKLSGSQTLFEALKALPDLMRESLLMRDSCDFAEQFFHVWTGAYQNGIILGRGFGYPIAQESALKLKETCALHAEAFSSAEFLHGPMGLIKKSFPVILYLQNDESVKGSLMTAKKIKEAGGEVWVISPKNLVESESGFSNRVLWLPESRHSLLDSVLGISVFYPIVAQLSVLRGMDPDQPLLLKKVTETR